MEAVERRWRPAWPCPARQILSIARRGAGDPTYRVDDAGAHWRGIRAPTGPAALRVWEAPSSGEVLAEAWGEGSEWVLEQLPEMLGAEDAWSGFEPRHPLLVEARKRHPPWRTGRHRSRTRPCGQEGVSN